MLFFSYLCSEIEIHMQMKRFENLEITNFRGIKNLRLDNLGQVNVLVGANNVGKSSILEALFILSGKQHPYLPGALNFIREAARKDFDHLKYLFYNADIERHPVISASTTSQEQHRVEISLMSEIDMEKQNINAGLSSQETRKITGVHMFCKDSKQEFEVKLFPNKEGDGLALHSTIRIMDEVIASFLPSNGREGNAVEMYSELVRSNKKNDIVLALKEFDSAVEDIDLLSDGIYLKYQDRDSLIPLSMAGDGIRRYLGIIMSAAISKANLLLIDEIENGLHYSIYAKLWKALITITQKNNIQLFVTTHNKEILRSLYSAYTELQPGVNNEDIKIYTLKLYENGSHIAYPLSTKGLEGAIDNEVEIR